MALVVSVALVGCGGASLWHGAPPGDAVRVDGVSYRVTRVAVLHPDAPEDRALLAGTAAWLPPGMRWLGVFVRATNITGSPRRATAKVAVADASNRVLRAVPPGRGNAYAYRPAILGPHAALPPPESPASLSPEQGSVLLFEVPLQDVRVRSALELRLYDPVRPVDFASVRLRLS